MSEQTTGQKMVGLSFNPSNDDAVGKAKQTFADAIDQFASWFRKHDWSKKAAIIHFTDFKY